MSPQLSNSLQNTFTASISSNEKLARAVGLKVN